MQGQPMYQAPMPMPQYSYPQMQQQQMMMPKPVMEQPSWLKKHWKAIVAGLLILFGILFFVLAAIQYNIYHKETNKESQKAKNAHNAAILFVCLGVGLLLIGGILAWYSAK